MTTLEVGDGLKDDDDDDDEDDDDDDDNDDDDDDDDDDNDNKLAYQTYLCDEGSHSKVRHQEIKLLQFFS